MFDTSVDSASFRPDYSKHLGYSFLAAAVIHFLLFCFFPQFEFTPYAQVEKGGFVAVPSPVFDLPEKPDRIPQPPVPVTADDPSEAQDPSLVPVTSPADISDFQPVGREAEPRKRSFVPFSEKPVLIHSVAPHYPPLPRSGGIEGDLLLKVLIDEKGKVTGVEVVSSDATKSLVKAAVEAAWQFRFRPARQGANPVRSSVIIPVRFRLN